MARFSNRTAVITGAASGMGRATARRIANEGGRVVSIDIADRGGADTVAMIDRDGGLPGLAIECDVADPAQVETAVMAALAFSGQIDVLVNCAGTGYYSHFTEQTPAEVERVMAVNFGGTFWTCRYAMDALLASRGCVVNIASAAAVRGCAYLSAYAASKGAVLAFTKSLAVEYGSRGLRAERGVPRRHRHPVARPVHATRRCRPSPDDPRPQPVRADADTG